jgi:glycyl-tRNA synthetase
MPEDVYDQVINIAKRRGFLYPAFEIYGGSAGFYDYGPLGSIMKARIEDTFRRIFVQEEGCAEIQCPAVTPHPVFEASGHVAQFTDPVLKCTQCHTPLRADHLLEENGYEGEAAQLSLEAIAGEVEERGIICPNCGGPFGPPFQQNLMFQTEIGPGSGQVGYLRPETAQGIFIDFPHLYRHFRQRLPFGVCQLGRAYRNEISPRQGMLRLREFNQMEAEYFFDPKKPTHPRFTRVKDHRLTFVPNTTGKAVQRTIGEAVADGMVCHRLMGYWLVRVHQLLTTVGLDPDRIRFRQHATNEMAHYANDCWDAEFHSERFGWVECVGVADRSAYDLKEHSKHSGVPMTALRRYKEPRRVKVVRLVPVHQTFGPLFRQRTKAVADALAALPDETAAAWSSGPLTVTVDGDEVEVPQDAIEKVEETVTRVGEEFTPNVVEPSFGVDRILYAALEHAHSSRETKEGTFTVLRLPKAMAPVEVGVFPLFTREGMDRKAAGLEARLRRAGLRTAYDESGSIGRRYARADEAGTPYCVTVDHQTLEDKTVTIRWRDTGKQERVPMGKLLARLRTLLVAG